MPEKTPSRRGSVTRAIHVKTSHRTELKNVTGDIAALVAESGCAHGVCHLYVPHTTAGVFVNEGDDPAVARDIETALDRMVPHSAGYTHPEGNANSHIKTALVGSSETVWIENGRLALGRWQSISFAEFDGPRSRELRVKILFD